MTVAGSVLGRRHAQELKKLLPALYEDDHSPAGFAWVESLPAATRQSPILTAAGSEAATARRLHASLTFGCLAMDAYAFGTSAPALQRALND